MKKIIFLIISLELFVRMAYSQGIVQEIPPCPDSTCMWGCPLPIKQVINESELVFEGRILSDSFVCCSHWAYVYHRVLVLKEFKGNFKSDTLEIANLGGNKICMDIAPQHETPDIHPGTEAVFIVGKVTPAINNNPNIFQIIWGACGFVKICDKKDINKEVYELIENATGQKYEVIHPNNCAINK